MVRLFVRHPVSDFAAWKQAYDRFNDERATMGVVDHEVFQALEDPNDVTIWHDFETLESATRFMESPRVREVMEAAGVAGEPQVWFTRGV